MILFVVSAADTSKVFSFLRLCFCKIVSLSHGTKKIVGAKRKIKQAGFSATRRRFNLDIFGRIDRYPLGFR